MQHDALMERTAVPSFSGENGMSEKRTNTNTERIHRLDKQDRSSTVTWQAREFQGVASTAFPRFLKAFTLAFGVIAGVAALSVATAADEGSAEFISTLGNDALAEMRSAASLDQKLAYFRQMLSQDFDLNGIARLFLAPTGAPRARSSSMSSAPSWKITSCSPTVGALQSPVAATSA